MDIPGEDNKDLLVNFKADVSPSQTRKDTAQFLRRETDSLDDFEHLEHDNHDKDTNKMNEPKLDDAFKGETTLTPRVENQQPTNETLIDNFASATENFAGKLDVGEKTENKNLFDAPISDLLGDMVPPVPPHAEPLIQVENKEFGDFQETKKDSILDFMESERNVFQPDPVKLSATPDIADRFSDSDQDTDEFKPSYHEQYSPKKEVFHPKSEYKDFIDEPEPALPERDYFETSDVPKETKSEPFKTEPPKPEPLKQEPPKLEPFKPEPPKQEPPKPEPPKQEPPKPEPPKQDPPKVEQPKPEAPKKESPKPEAPVLKPAKKEVIAAEAMFCKMGLDAWFNPERLNPKVESLIYWRDPKKSGIVFGGTLVILLSLAYFSLISVFAYLSLFALCGTISFRIYKNVLQAVQKTADGHPFKEFLEADVTLPQEKVKEITEVAVTHVNAAVTELRRLFLVEDLVDSIKFGVLLWCLTYLGAWFNGMTILIMAFVALFTLPKVYENNKTQIDANLDIVRSKLADITSKVKAAIPIGKKSEEKKEQ